MTYGRPLQHKILPKSNMYHQDIVLELRIERKRKVATLAGEVYRWKVSNNTCPTKMHSSSHVVKSVNLARNAETYSPMSNAIRDSFNAGKRRSQLFLIETTLPSGGKSLKPPVLAHVGEGVWTRLTLRACGAIVLNACRQATTTVLLLWAALANHSLR